MFLSYEWLNDFVDLSKIKADELADKMSRTGIEIEGVENYGANLSNLVVGEVVECVDHPNSDHLHLTKVDVGQDALLQIVCGAPNVHAGAKVIVAMIGAVLPGGFKIKKSKLFMCSHTKPINLNFLSPNDSVRFQLHCQQHRLIPQ